jgi:hypothetical protein
MCKHPETVAVADVNNQASNHGFTRNDSCTYKSLDSNFDIRLHLLYFLHTACIDTQNCGEPATVKLDRCMAGTHRTMAHG